MRGKKHGFLLPLSEPWLWVQDKLRDRSKAEILAFTELGEGQGLSGTVWGAAVSSWKPATTLCSSGELTWNFVKIEVIGHKNRIKKVFI